MKTRRINVGKNLQRVEREWSDGRIHSYFRARFIDWQGIERTPRARFGQDDGEEGAGERRSRTIRCAH